MSPEQAAIILNTIAVRSNERAIPWTVTGDDDAYEAPYENYTIRIAKELIQEANDEFSYAVYYLEILNDSGIVVSSIRPRQVDRYIKNASEFTGDLFSNARDKALGVDQIIDKLLADLGGAVPPITLAKNDFEDDIPF